MELKDKLLENYDKRNKSLLENKEKALEFIKPYLIDMKEEIEDSYVKGLYRIENNIKFSGTEEQRKDIRNILSELNWKLDKIDPHFKWCKFIYDDCQIPVVLTDIYFENWDKEDTQEVICQIEITFGANKKENDRVKKEIIKKIKI